MNKNQKIEAPQVLKRDKNQEPMEKVLCALDTLFRQCQGPGKFNLMFSLNYFRLCKNETGLPSSCINCAISSHALQLLMILLLSDKFKIVLEVFYGRCKGG